MMSEIMNLDREVAKANPERECATSQKIVDEVA